MAKIKLTDLIKIIFILIIICAYQNFKIQDYQKILKEEKIRKSKMNNIQQNANLKKFLKSKEKMFQKNENLKNSIFNISKTFRINHILFKETSLDKFELKFKINNEEDLYSILNKLRTELNGIIFFDEVKVKNLEKSLQVALVCKIFYPSQNLKKYFYINKINEEEFPEIFDLQKTKNYQLNGILHYDTAYINGNPFHEGDSIGKYKIIKIHDEFITVKSKKKSLNIKIDETW